MAHLYDIFKTATTDDFLYEVSAGNIPGVFLINKFFRHPSLSTSVSEIWDYGGVEPNYTYTVDDGADYYLTSSNAVDNQLIDVYFLDEKKDRFYIARVKLNGTTPVKLNDIGKFQDNSPEFAFVTPWKISEPFKCTRVFRIKNRSSVSFAGDIYCVDGAQTYGTPGIPDDTKSVRAYVNNGNNVTLMCQTPVPLNYHGFIFTEATSISRKTADSRASVTKWERIPGESFLRGIGVDVSTQATSYVKRDRQFPIKLEPGTDITYKGIASANCILEGDFSLLLVDSQFVDKASDHVHE